MRIKIYNIPIFLMVASCSQNIEPKKLIGSWKMRDVINQTEQNVSDKTTFDNDSLVVEIFADKKLNYRVSAKYKFDKTFNIIHYEIMSIKIDLKILKLTNTEMELLNTKEKKSVRYIRIQ